MKRLSIIGVCLVAVCVCSAMAVGSASALPTLKLSKGTFPVSFTSTSAESVLRALNGLKLACTSATNTGLIASADLADHVIVTFKGCTAEALGFILQCQTSATEPNVIKTKSLHGWLGYIHKNPATEGKNVGMLLGPESGSVLAAFECTGSIKVTEETTGEVIGEITPLNTPNTSKFTLNFTKTAAEMQAIETFELLPGVHTPQFMEKVTLTTHALGAEEAYEETSDAVTFGGGAEGDLEA